MNALKGHAKIRFIVVRSQINNFNKFNIQFRNEFLSDVIQHRLEAWKSQKYSNGSVLNYLERRLLFLSCR